MLVGQVSIDITSSSLNTILSVDYVSVIATHTYIGDLSYILGHIETGSGVILMDRPGYPVYIIRW